MKGGKKKKNFTDESFERKVCVGGGGGVEVFFSGTGVIWRKSMWEYWGGEDDSSGLAFSVKEFIVSFFPRSAM